MNLCKAGHDKDVVGTRSQGWCNECARAARRKGPDPMRFRTLPFAPLEVMAPLYVPDGFGMHSGVSTMLPPRLERQWYRARNSGVVSLGTADELAVAFGYHPYEIWGDDWWTA